MEDDVPHHGPKQLGKALAMLTFGATGRAGLPVLLFDIVAFRALVVVVVDVLRIRLRGMERVDFCHGGSSRFFKVD